MTAAIPDAALAQHIAILGKTGSGKTSTAKLAVEQVVAAGARVCVLDPIKSDWWGLTSSADGQQPGLSFHILGGPHGHVPLHASAGAAIGELVATGRLPLSIIDMADFEPGGHQQFPAFASAMLRKMRGVVYLIIEEAHEFAPKERAGFNAENMAIHFAKKLATAGRSKGIRLIVATQRVQALHNAVLGSCDTVIAHRLTAPADQEPVKKWLKANTEKAVADQVATSLASLKTGTAWLCSGEAKVFELVHFPRIATYDNSATPTGDGADHHVATAPVDREKLKAIIGDAVQQAVANDPEALKAEIAKLKAELQKAQSSPNGNTIDPAALVDAEKRGYERGFDEAFIRGVRALGDLWSHLLKPIFKLKEGFEDIEAIHDQLFEAVEGRAEGAPSLYDAPVEHRQRATGKWADIKAGIEQRSKMPLATDNASRASEQARPARPSVAATAGDGSLTGPQRELLAAIAWWNALGTEAPSRAQVAAVAGWRVTSGHLKNVAGSLRTRSLIEYPTNGTMTLTSAGRDLAPAPDLSVPAVERVRAVLSGPQQQVIDRLLKHGQRPFARDKLAESCGWEPMSGHIKNVLGSLRSLELIDYPANGQVRAADWLFP